MACPCSEHIPHGFGCIFSMEVAIAWTTWVRLAICLSKKGETPTSFTFPTCISCLAPNYWEFSAMLAIKFLALVGVLSTRAFPLTVSINVMSILNKAS